MDFAGYAVGGLSVGEEPADMLRMLEATVPELPADRPRYLMGVGRPEDLLEAIRRGIDLFDCVMPTRNGRNSMAFTDAGRCGCGTPNTSGTSGRSKSGCPCAACRRSRGYIRHLFMAGEMLGPILLSIHNLTYYQRLLADARRAIETDRFEQIPAGEVAGMEWQSVWLVCISSVCREKAVSFQRVWNPPGKGSSQAGKQSERQGGGVDRPPFRKETAVLA